MGLTISAVRVAESRRARRSIVDAARDGKTIAAVIGRIGLMIVSFRVSPIGPAEHGQDGTDRLPLIAVFLKITNHRIV